MEIHIEPDHHGVIVRLSGEIDASTAPALEEALNLYTTQGAYLVIDMQDVVFMSSAGLRQMLLLQRSLTQQGGEAVLCRLRPEIASVMEVTGFLEFFTLHDSVEGALAGRQQMGG